MKKLLAALALVVISCFWWASAEEVNLAKNCKVEACGYNSNGGLTGTEVENPELAVDGNADTKWDCNVKSHDELADSGKLHWIMLDLGSQKEFNKIVLKHASNTTIDKDFPTYNTRQMTLEYSNDKSNWTQFLTILNGDQKPVNTRYFDKITARYIRLNIQISGTIDTDARIAEIEVYNSSETPVKEEDVPLNATTTATIKQFYGSCTNKSFFSFGHFLISTRFSGISYYSCIGSGDFRCSCGCMRRLGFEKDRI